MRPMAETLVVYAKTDADAGSKGITAFLIEKDMRRFLASARRSRRWACAVRTTSELVFEDCHVPEENVLGDVGKAASAC